MTRAWHGGDVTPMPRVVSIQKDACFQDGATLAVVELYSRSIYKDGLESDQNYGDTSPIIAKLPSSNFHPWTQRDGIMKSTTSVALACLALLPLSSLTTAASSGDNFRYASKKTITLRSNGFKHAVKILDFGENIEGHPTFEVVSASGNTSIFEVSFAESLSAFDRYMVCNAQLSWIRGILESLTVLTINSYCVERWPYQPGSGHGQLPRQETQHFGARSL
jgi:hypothetical protein